MDFKREKKLMRQEFFPIGGFIVISILALAGIGIILLAIYTLEDTVTIHNLIYAHGFELLISSFFIVTAIYVWLFFIINYYRKPYIDVLYYIEVNNDKFFINAKGDKIQCVENIDEPTDKYYKVYRTHNYVLSVKEEYNETDSLFEPIIKENYWLNLYLPNGEEERDILILPILYVLAVPGLLCFLFAEENMQRFVGIVFMFVPVYTIIYDFIQKYKRR